MINTNNVKAMTLTVSDFSYLLSLANKRQTTDTINQILTQKLLLESNFYPFAMTSLYSNFTYV
jgi:hypothetical protein